MENFTPISALIGGVLIGTASMLLLWFNGRMAGISGIAGGFEYPEWSDLIWRLLFMAGLIIGAGIYRTVGDSFGGIEITSPVKEIEIVSSIPVLVLAGLLTGIGTRMGRGCTSGHGICGLARLSGRSFTAVSTFLFVAAATFFFTRHIIGG